MVWAGAILVFLACVHLVSTSVLSAAHIPAWFQGELWLFPPSPGDLTDLAANVGAFWMVWGSFGVPLGLIGALVVGFGRRGQVPPAYLGIGVAGWALIGALLFEPSPFVLGLVPAGMLLAAAYKRRP
ncbi:hypothetical protein HII36_32545 [Nonomuraea sp. NN258]|uniref:hypothetical protein n=1 Tax=Nonomuraea antri TaxID=2730852 RepID=UPI0015697374|nr:hypothetical protein [Nonomuraea antri]NRQ36528.1 hypothetical protein [Nonomuraea antri]